MNDLRGRDLFWGLFLAGIMVLVVMLLFGEAVEAAEMTCRFSWDQVTTEADGVTPERGLAGYRLHTATQAGGPYSMRQEVPVASLLDPAAPMLSLPCQEGFYWVVTAYDAAGNESGFSNEVQVPDITPPAIPGFRLEEVTEVSEERTTRTTRTVTRIGE